LTRSAAASSRLSAGIVAEPLNDPGQRFNFGGRKCRVFPNPSLNHPVPEVLAERKDYPLFSFDACRRLIPQIAINHV
jgi:hypothetical protein